MELLLANFNAMSDDFLPAGENIVTIVEFYEKDAKASDPTRGYVDDTIQLVAWFQNDSGRMPHYFSVGGYVPDEDIKKNKDFWISEADPKDLGITAAAWKKMSDAEKLSAAYSKAGKYAVYNHKDGGHRILDPKRAKSSVDILRRFAAAVMGNDYKLGMTDGRKAFLQMQQDFVGKAVKVYVSEDQDGNLVIDARKRGAFTKA